MGKGESEDSKTMTIAAVLKVGLVSVGIAIAVVALKVTYDLNVLNEKIDRCYDETSSDYIWDNTLRVKECSEAKSGR